MDPPGRALTLQFQSRQGIGPGGDTDTKTGFPRRRVLGWQDIGAGGNITVSLDERRMNHRDSVLPFRRAVTRFVRGQRELSRMIHVAPCRQDAWIFHVLGMQYNEGTFQRLAAEGDRSLHRIDRHSIVSG